MTRTTLIGDPDACAAAAIGLDPASSPDTVLHSTSLRWIDGRVVLTYLYCPDPLRSRDGTIVRPASDHPAAIDPA